MYMVDLFSELNGIEQKEKSPCAKSRLKKKNGFIVFIRLSRERESLFFVP